MHDDVADNALHAATCSHMCNCTIDARGIQVEIAVLYQVHAWQCFTGGAHGVQPATNVHPIYHL